MIPLEFNDDKYQESSELDVRTHNEANPEVKDERTKEEKLKELEQNIR